MRPSSDDPAATPSTGPISILREAIEQVPAVKYALAVGGIMAVIAIVMGWKLDPRVAVFGTIIMFFLMSMMVLFAKLSVSGDEVFRAPAVVFLWASVILTIATAILLFTSVFFRWPLSFVRPVKPSDTADRSAPGDDQVWALEHELIAIRGTWEALSDQGDPRKDSIQARATQLTQQLQNIDDNSLSPGAHLYKLTAECYSLIIEADTEDNASQKLDLIKQAGDLCSRATSDLTYIAANKDKNASLNALNQSIIEKDQVFYVDYLTAIAGCMQAVATKNAQLKATVLEDLRNNVPSFYLQENPLRKDKDLKYCVSGDAK